MSFERILDYRLIVPELMKIDETWTAEVLRDLIEEKARFVMGDLEFMRMRREYLNNQQWWKVVGL